MAKTNIPDTINDARRVSTPLIAISTPDPAALIKQIVAALPEGVGVVEWDVVNGTAASNAAGEAAREQDGQRRRQHRQQPGSLCRQGRPVTGQLHPVHAADRSLAEP